jgi:predicted RNA-binding Zn-ribbon protein involved in translation (DUF1610 family)
LKKYNVKEYMVFNRKQGKKKKSEQEEKQKKSLSRTQDRENADYSFVSSENSEELQTERRQAYLERSTQNLLRGLLKDGKNEEILPTYDPNSGFIYKKIEHVFEEETSREQATEFLERLTQLDILKKSFYDTVSTCPYCESTSVTLHYHCPKCKSHHIVKTSLTEHIPCGYITEREKFIQDKCPRCGEPLTEKQYRDMGRWYICRECNERFEHPKLEIICRKCDKSFTIEESKVLEIPKYALNTKRRSEIKQNVASLDGIIILLNSLNFQVETPGIATGQKSGMDHHFSLLARKADQNPETVLAVDHVVSENEVHSSPLIHYIYKTSEVKIDLPIFIAIPKLSESAKKIAQGHQILLIEGSPESIDAIFRIRTEIENKLEQRKVKSEPEITTLQKEQGEEENQSTYKTKIKPQLFSTTSSIHQPRKNTTKKTGGFLKNLKKTIKKTKDSSNS